MAPSTEEGVGSAGEGHAEQGEGGDVEDTPVYVAADGVGDDWEDVPVEQREPLALTWERVQEFADEAGPDVIDDCSWMTMPDGRVTSSCSGPEWIVAVHSSVDGPPEPTETQEHYVEGDGWLFTARSAEPVEVARSLWEQ